MKIENLEVGHIIEIPLRWGKVGRHLLARVTGVARWGGVGIQIEAEWLDTGESFRFWRSRGYPIKIGNHL